jgi:hypothetical protein
MSTKSHEVICGSRIRGARIHADDARQAAVRAVREAHAAAAEAWSVRREGCGGPAQPSPTMAPVNPIKLTKQREIDPYLWVHPDRKR